MNLDRDELLEKLKQLFQETGRAHHHAFLATNGDDPEWAAWYAEYLAPKLKPPLGVSIEKADLAKLLTRTEDERQKRTPPPDWPRFYAEAILRSRGRGGE